MRYPDFIDNDTYFKLDRSASQHDQLTAMTHNLKLVHNLTTRHYDDFNELINGYLRAGIEIFQMQTGIVSHITDDKQYILKDVVTPLTDILHKGDVFELEGTYCREVAKSGHTLGFPHVGEIEELKGHPVYVNLKLESYISAPIYVRETLYGTLNFTSTQPREFGFSEMEHDLISMLANAIGNFILLQEKEHSLLAVNNRLKEMVGHVAHDLRNPVGAAKLLAEMAIKYDFSGEKLRQALEGIHTAADSSLELINTMLQAAALGTGKITLETAPFQLKKLVEQSIEENTILAQQQNIALNVQVPHDITIDGDEARLRQVINNLLINALKYAPADSEVIIGCSTDNKSSATVSITNSINGASTKALDNTVYQSIGFGLDIVSSILELHGSELAVNTTPQSYTVTFTLPLHG